MFHSFKVAVCIGLLTMSQTVAASSSEARAALSRKLANAPDPVTRGDLIRMVVEMNGGPLYTKKPADPVFSDVPESHSLFSHFMDAAKSKWFLGVKDCYGIDNACEALPNNVLTRDALAPVVVKAFGLEYTGDTPPRYSDISLDDPNGRGILTLSEYCPLQPDSRGRFNPNQSVTKQELIDILVAIDQGSIDSQSVCSSSVAASSAITTNSDAASSSPAQSRAPVNTPTPTSSPQSTQAFVDVTAAHPHAQAISYVQEAGIVSGFPNGTYRPDQAINRAEFTKIIIGAIYSRSLIEQCDSTYFTDGTPGSWYNTYVCTAKDTNIISGYADGSFRPAANINFAEASKIIANAYALLSEGKDSSPWFKKYIAVLAFRHAIPSDITSFEQPVTRGQMAEMIYRLRTDNRNEPSMTYEQLSGQ